MPIKVTAWSCKFKCGAKVQTVKNRIVDHEKRCILNPATKCCPTCKHNYKEWETHYECHRFGEPIDYEYPIWCCEIEKFPCDEKGYFTKTFVRGCDYWKPKEG
jgi:hypothetical protein